MSLSPLLDPNTRKKIDILGRDFHAALFEWVAPDQVPAEMGGQDPTPFGQSPEEVAMRAHVDAVASGQWDGLTGECPGLAEALAAAEAAGDGGGGIPENPAAAAAAAAAVEAAEA